MNKFKFYLKSVVIITIIGYFAYCLFFTLTNPATPTYEDTGTIVSKSNDEVAIKHGTATELYLNIQFDNSGFRSIESDPETYFKYKVGQRLTYNLAKDKTTNYIITWTIGALLIVICCFCAIVLFFVWLFSEE